MNITGNVNFFTAKDEKVFSTTNSMRKTSQDTRHKQNGSNIKRQRPKSGIVTSGQSLNKNRFNTSKNSRKINYKKAP